MAPEKPQGQQAQNIKSTPGAKAPEKTAQRKQVPSGKDTANANANPKAAEKPQGHQAPNNQGNARPKGPEKTKGQQAQENQDNQAKALSKEQQDREASQAAQNALYYKQRAQEYAKAANGCADPDERQKLMEMKIEEYIKAEKFGKTAKYMQSGGFQGFAAGSGLGVGLGVTLGTLTGTLVGGPVSLLTGGIGALAGAAHGPFFNLASVSGSVIRKITGDLPGWKATTEQKRALEKMCGQINEMEEPTAEELKGIAGDNVGEVNAAVSSAKQSAGSSSWGQTATSWIPGASSMPSWGSGEKQETNVEKQRKLNAAKQDQEAKSSLQNASAPKPQAESQQAQAKQASEKQAKQAPKSAQSGGQQSTPQQPEKPSQAGQKLNTEAQTAEAKPAQNTRPGPRKLGKPSTSGQSAPSTPKPKPSGTTAASQNAQKPSSKPLTSANCQASNSKASSGPANNDRKKPRKLEPRSASTPQASTQKPASKAQESSPPAKRRSPRKLDSRSQA